MRDLPPRPWDWVTSKIPGGNGSFHIYIVDGNGRKIAALYGKAEERIAMAQFIVTDMNSGTRGAGDTVPPAGRHPSSAL